jgi:AcrR family transcriptional regulator
MAEQAEDAERRRPRLSRERVVEAALAIADADGLGALTIRSLATELGVKPMSVYYHVASKDEILAALVDIVFGEIVLPVPGRDWRPEMERRADSAREVLARHRWAIGLLESRPDPGPANLRHHDTVIATLRAGGFSPEMTAHAYALIDSYVYGFALQEASLPFDTADELADMAKDVFLPQLPPDEFPYLNESAAVLVADGYDPAEAFIFGLDLVLAALEPLRASA